MAVTMMENMINPQVMGDMIDAKIEALAKITPYAKVGFSSKINYNWMKRSLLDERRSNEIV